MKRALALTLVVLAWAARSFRSSPKQKVSGNLPQGELKEGETNESKRGSTVQTVISATSALTAVLSVVFAYSQVVVARGQEEVARSSLQQTIRSEDLKVAGGISIDLDNAKGRITVQNGSGLPMTEVAVWTLGISQSPDEENRLDILRAPLSGVPSCHSMQFSRADFTASAGEHTSSPAASEAYVTFKVPSGDWYTISNRKSYDPPQHEQWSNAIEASEGAYSSTILSDTVLEGDISDVREDQSILPIGEKAEVSGFTSGNAKVRPGSCSGGSA